MTEMKSEES